ncbi:MAG: hypothetical protein HY077_07440 [Elusimicrobia bacterium]|nr:hypothetical protein [Elusimicrobiota bacterium]
MKVPAVARLQTDGRAAPFAHQGLTSRILVGIRVRAGQSVGETLKAVVADLEARAHFRLERAVGYQEVPETKDLAVVAVGEVPILELSRVMAHPDVLKVLPAPGRDSESSVPRQPSKRVGDLKPGAEPARFIFFVERRAPLLIVATLMLLLLPIGGRALRWLNVFSPYRR